MKSMDGAVVLILGNSPAVGMVDLAELPESVVTLGVNRIQEWEPDWTMIIDDNVAPEYLPENRESLITIPGCKYKSTPGAQRFEPACRVTEKHPGAWRWPTTDRMKYVCVRNTGGYALQWACVHGAREVALLGIDYNEQQLRDAGQDTHHYGVNKYGKSPVTKKRLESPEEFATRRLNMEISQILFWRFAFRHCGRPLWNLSPYDDAPFHQCGIPRKRWAAWLAEQS